MLGVVAGVDDGVGKRQRPFLHAAGRALGRGVLRRAAAGEEAPPLLPDQVRLLERSFEAENKLEPERKTELARQLMATTASGRVVPEPPRARWKTKQLERDFDRLKSSYDSLLADRDSPGRTTTASRSQVAALLEKLQAKEAAPGNAGAKQDAYAAEVMEEKVPVKAEDRVSIGSGNSAVVDGERHQLVDSSGRSPTSMRNIREDAASVEKKMMAVTTLQLCCLRRSPPTGARPWSAWLGWYIWN
ncbi:hypothetical protein J5N97_005135 [Dioscorea zingiberensis]|uniref:Homeobox-leucine zipper protein n=1 Tax=Dioscorea zingiberensis TaxID=325984 RepID=A0A9D5HS37_9LILI|nr:hypothetical protein J5N97_005135 [Dioscorea zingiberensis]